MKRLFLSTALAAVLWIGPARAQPTPTPGCLNGSPCVAVQAFTPVATTTLAVTTTTGSVAFPATGGGNLNALVTNNGTVTVFYAVGNSLVTATTSSAPLVAGQSVAVVQGANTTLAAITGSSTATLAITSGTGQPAINYAAYSAAGSSVGSVTQGAGGSSPWLVSLGSRTIVPLDISSVTTGGTAVSALSAGHATAGGFLVTSNAAGICVNQVGAAGTATSGNTQCVAQNQAFALVPSAAAVSVNSSASSVTFGGEGLQ